jgi:p24 family protein alpha
VQHVKREQAYQRSRESHFRSISDDTNARVLWWSIAQTVVLVALGLWQLHHLKTFFRAKKLV